MHLLDEDVLDLEVIVEDLETGEEFAIPPLRVVRSDNTSAD